VLGPVGSQEHPAEATFAAGHNAPVVELAGLVVYHLAVTEDFAVELHCAVGVGHSDHRSADSAVVAALVDEDVTVFHCLEMVAPGIPDPEGGLPVRRCGQRTDLLV